MGVNMKLVIILSTVAFVRCDFSPTTLSAPTSILHKPALGNIASKVTTFSALPNASEKTKLNFHNLYNGFYSPLQYPPINFSKFNNRDQFFTQIPLKPYLSAPQISSFQGISPPFSNIISPILGGNPSFPINPTQIFPPSVSPPVFPRPPFNSPFPLINNFPSNSNFGLYSNYFGNIPSSFSSLPTPLFSSIPLFSKDTPQLSESVPTTYGPPAAAPSEESSSSSTETPTETSESNSSVGQQPISFPYEPAAPDAPEQQPFTPAQEYGPPNKQ